MINQKETQDAIAIINKLANSYNKNAYDGKDRIIEINFTDIKKSYQIVLGKQGSTIHTDGSLVATTRIDTPYSVWASIASGEISAGEALGKQLYTVTGDFSFMIKWGKYFDINTVNNDDNLEELPEENELKKPLMTTMLIPWIVYWTAISSNPKTGSIITLAVCVLLPLLRRSHKLVLWDKLTFALVAILSAGAYINGDGNTFTSIGYLLFGLIWILSCIFKEPLTATYVKYQYGGDRACRNLLFMKTNYILTYCWGVLYVLTAIWTWILQSDGLGYLSLIINFVIPAGMGIFTLWFQKWYPAYVASGKGGKHHPQ